MNKKERIEAIKEGVVPDRMPIFPFLLTQIVYHCGWTLPDVTSRDGLDVEKSVEASLRTYRDFDLDIIHGSYFDVYFGLEAIGGEIEVPPQFGGTVSAVKFPVESQTDWPHVKKRLHSVFEKDNRIKGFIDATRITAKEVGDEVTIAVWGMPGATSCSCLIREISALCLDMVEQPKFAYEMCDYANKFTIEFIRRQYEAGANGFTLLGDVFGDLISPEMFEEFGLPFIDKIVEVVKKEFDQDVWFHYHGNCNKPAGIKLLDTLVNEIGVKALHLDEKHDVAWLTENVADKYKIPTAIPYHGPYIREGPEERIEKDVKKMVQECNPKYTYMSASCDVVCDTPKSHLQTWLKKTQEYNE